MKKFKEILLLKNLKRVGNVAINGKYNQLLNDAEDINDLITKMETEAKFTAEDLQTAKDKAEKVYNYVNDSQINVITIFDDNYPEKLNAMKNNKPPLLYVKGNVEALNKPNMAVIGTRKPSKLSEEFESNLVKHVVNTTDNVIVSGLALGCDKIAHQTTVDEEKITIAVLPSGVDVIKPAKHKKLAEEIIENNGCLVSEYEPKVNPNRGSYVQRDKIVAALCDATFVVECGVKSGTMHTVKFSDEYGTPIFSYLPSERPEDSFDGNEFILNEFEDSTRIEYVEEFLNELEFIKNRNTSDKPLKKEVQSRLL